MIYASVMAPNMTPYQGWTPCMAWCHLNCEGWWEYQTEGVFVFEKSSDHLMFMLAWQ
jgi:hypothetical protein